LTKAETREGTIIRQGSTPYDSAAVPQGPVEPTDPDLGTFADVENGDPDSMFDEIVLDAAII
jgi:hypothetical protein